MEVDEGGSGGGGETGRGENREMSDMELGDLTNEDEVAKLMKRLEIHVSETDGVSGWPLVRMNLIILEPQPC